MIYYKTSLQCFERPVGKAVYFVAEEGQNIVIVTLSKRVLIPVHKYTCDLSFNEPLEDRPDLRERGVKLAELYFKSELTVRLQCLLDAASQDPFYNPDDPVTLVVVEATPPTLVWGDDTVYGTAIFGIAAFCCAPEGLVGIGSARVNFPVGFEKISLTEE